LRPTRDFNYVSDICLGFLAIAESKETIGKEFNISSGLEISIADTFALIMEIMNSDVEIITDHQRLRPNNSEVFRLCGDNNLLFRLTGFKPKTDIRTGLELSCDWFAKPENLKKYKPEIYNL
jgi:nucleoside-diphosphate-sugar epimerase